MPSRSSSAAIRALVLEREIDARRLRAVAQRRVEEIEALAGHGFSRTSKSFSAGSRALFQSGRGGPNWSARSLRLVAAMSTGTVGSVSPVPGPCSFGRATCAVMSPRRRRGGEVVGVRRDHHAFAGLVVERLGRGEIDARLRLVVAGDLGAEDRVPGKIVARARGRPSARCCRSTPARAGSLCSRGSARRGSGQAVEPVPGEVECAQRRLVET